MMIHVIRSMALLFRWSCIALSCKFPRSQHKQAPPARGRETYQVLRDRDLLVQHLHARPDLHVLPHGIVQRLQARLVPEQLGHVQHVAHQVHVPPEREEPPGELQRVLARHGEHACLGELRRDRARARRGEDSVRVRLVVRQQGGLCERVRDGELEEV